MAGNLGGLWVPVATPFSAFGGVDLARLVSHCRRLLAQSAAGLAVLGTTSEANSLSLEERRAVIDAVLSADIPAARVIPGTGSPSIGDATTLTRHAAAAGCAGVLLLPPFYYKGISDDGLFAFVAKLIDGCGAVVPRILLYHIPPQAVIGWSIALIDRLRTAFPEVVIGMKDSSGDIARIKTALARFPNFAVFPGSEVGLVDLMNSGAAGSISATGNINTRAVADLIARYRDADAARRQEDANALRSVLQARGPIPSIKAVLSEIYRDRTWREVRPPLMPLSDDERTALLATPPVRALLAALAPA